MKTNWLKKLTLPVLAMAFVYYLTKSGEDPATKNLVQNITNQQSTLQTSEISEDCYEVYALHDSGYMVKTYVEKGEETDQVQAVFDLLTIKSNQLPLKTTSLISPMTVLNDYTLNDETLTLDLSKEFLNYDASQEQQVVESLVWSFTSLEGVDRVKFEIDGQPVSNLNGTLAVERGLTRQMGINLEMDTNNLDNTQLVTLYFMTDDTQNGLLVPVTRLIPSSVDPVNYAIDSLIQGSVGGEYISVFDNQTTLMTEPVIENGVITLNFSSDLYYDNNQTVVSSLMHEQLVMTLTEFDGIEAVSVLIDGNSKIVDDTLRSVAIPTSRNIFEPVNDAISK